MNEKIVEDSKDKILQLKEALKGEFSKEEDEDTFCKRICIYACGSLGRLEMTKKSDLDLFFIIMNEGDEEFKNPSNLDKYRFFSKIYNVNKEQGFEAPSGQGKYWEFIHQKNLLDIGSRHEDFNNSFTARMLLILESKPLYNEEAYEMLLSDIIDRYFVDFEEYRDEFYPLYLMNDIWRYWYTLTLNYEYGRDPEDPDEKKRWKRLKLKYARLITCFSMLACLYKKEICPEDVKKFIKMTPFERLDMLASENNKISNIVEKIKEEYGWFLNLRNEDTTWWEAEDHKRDAMDHATIFHQIVIHKFMKAIEETNKPLKDKMDIY